MKTIDSRFTNFSCYTVMKDCMKIFIYEKHKLRTIFLTISAKVCLTTDTWTLVQNLNYMCITCHFIDSD
jgi:hypothetical protein